MSCLQAEPNADDVAAAKAALRRTLADRGAGMPPADRAAASTAVTGRLAAWDLWHRAKRVVLYAALPGELDLTALFRQGAEAGKQLVLPRYCPAGECYELAALTDWNLQTRTGRFGIREPLAGLPALSDADRCDDALLWLVPGIAFDRTGRRLGRGGGFYDRLLAGARGLRVGVAVSWRIVPAVPAAAADQPVHWLATEDDLLPCSPLSTPISKVA